MTFEEMLKAGASPEANPSATSAVPSAPTSRSMTYDQMIAAGGKPDARTAPAQPTAPQKPGIAESALQGLKSFIPDITYSPSKEEREAYLKARGEFQKKNPLRGLLMDTPFSNPLDPEIPRPPARPQSPEEAAAQQTHPIAFGAGAAAPMLGAIAALRGVRGVTGARAGTIAAREAAAGASQAAAESTTGLSEAGRQAANFFRQVRDANLNPEALSPASRSLYEKGMQLLGGKAESELGPALAKKEVSAQAYRDLLSSQGDRAAQYTAQRLSKTEALKQLGNWAEKYDIPVLKQIKGLANLERENPALMSRLYGMFSGGTRVIDAPARQSLMGIRTLRNVRPVQPFLSKDMPKQEEQASQ